jgi:hypothetical protein
VPECVLTGCNRRTATPLPAVTRPLAPPPHTPVVNLRGVTESFSTVGPTGPTAWASFTGRTEACCTPGPGPWASARAPESCMCVQRAQPTQSCASLHPPLCIGSLVVRVSHVTDGGGGFARGRPSAHVLRVHRTAPPRPRLASTLHRYCRQWCCPACRLRRLATVCGVAAVCVQWTSGSTWEGTFQDDQLQGFGLWRATSGAPAKGAVYHHDMRVCWTEGRARVCCVCVGGGNALDTATASTLGPAYPSRPRLATLLTGVGCCCCCCWAHAQTHTRTRLCAALALLKEWSPRGALPTPSLIAPLQPWPLTQTWWWAPSWRCRRRCPAPTDGPLWWTRVGTCNSPGGGWCTIPRPHRVRASAPAHAHTPPLPHPRMPPLQLFDRVTAFTCGMRGVWGRDPPASLQSRPLPSRADPPGAPRWAGLPTHPTPQPPPASPALPRCTRQPRERAPGPDVVPGGAGHPRPRHAHPAHPAGGAGWGCRRAPRSDVSAGARRAARARPSAIPLPFLRRLRRVGVQRRRCCAFVRPARPGPGEGAGVLQGPSLGVGGRRRQRMCWPETQGRGAPHSHMRQCRRRCRHHCRCRSHCRCRCRCRRRCRCRCRCCAALCTPPFGCEGRAVAAGAGLHFRCSCITGP